MATENGTEPNDKLVRSNTGLAGTVRSLLTLQEQSLLSELDLTATNCKTILEPRLSAEFLRALSEFPPGAVEAAFRGWRDVSPYFPTISDIRELCVVWCREKRARDEAARQAEERKTANDGRARGELIDFADIQRQLARVAEGCAIPEPEKRRREWVSDHPQGGPPALQLTQEQIEARKAAELAEIKRYAEGE